MLVINLIKKRDRTLQLILKANGANNNMKITQAYIELRHSYIVFHRFLKNCSHLKMIDSDLEMRGCTA